ncbi:MAG: hypothetical protein FWG66_04325, partial [Spirochaetes bacterium]|nr:hypothetical protein [Spirochaetota bacterium]
FRSPPPYDLTYSSCLTGVYLASQNLMRVSFCQGGSLLFLQIRKKMRRVPLFYISALVGSLFNRDYPAHRQGIKKGIFK